MIKVDKGVVEWKKEDTENKEQIFAELFVLLDTVIANTAMASHKSVHETRELIFDSYYSWCSENEKEASSYDVAKEDLEYHLNRFKTK